MKIIEPSAHIEELPENIYQRIDKAASVCYQRPAKPTVEEAMEFCRGMIKRKHWMPLEFATVHLVVDRYWVKSYLAASKYIQVRIHGDRVVVTGSIRSFMEADDGLVENSIWNALCREYPIFFNGRRDGGLGGVGFAQPHELPWQHEHVAVRVVCSRAISHQLVRHRPCAILQESQRYCRYDGERFDGEVTFIRPGWWGKSRQSLIGSCEYDWESHMSVCENRYREFLSRGKAPQEARGVLTNDAKTELLIYANLPEWRHILNEETMRCSPHADPEMQRIMKPLREEFKGRWPEQFK